MYEINGAKGLDDPADAGEILWGYRASGRVTSLIDIRMCAQHLDTAIKLYMKRLQFLHFVF